MVAFADLNISNTNDKKKLQSLVETAAHLGYSTVAINHLVEIQPKKQEIAKPKCVSDLFDQFPIVQGTSKPIKVLNRLTLMVSDASHFRPTSEFKSYDIVAVYPKTEKLFHAACMTFDVDIICVAVTEKQPFHFKRPPVFGAIERGVFFEISYASAIKDSTMRRYTISNAINLMETCKGKNVIVSSGAEMPLELRGPYDIANLCPLPVWLTTEPYHVNEVPLILNWEIRGLLFGLSEGDGKAAVSTNCRAVLLHGETRKTALGIIHTMKRMLPAAEEQDEDEGLPASKKAKVNTV